MTCVKPRASARVGYTLRTRDGTGDSRTVTDETQRVTDTETTEANAGAPPQDVVRQGGTFEAFRYRAYSLFWSGAVVSNIGTWMQNYALAIVVYSFRHSELDLGIVSFVSGIPTLLLAIPGGAIADRFNKRMLIAWSQGALGVLAAALALLYGDTPDRGHEEQGLDRTRR